MAPRREVVEKWSDARQAKLAPAKAGVLRSESYVSTSQRRWTKPNPRLKLAGTGAAGGRLSTTSHEGVCS